MRYVMLATLLHTRRQYTCSGRNVSLLTEIHYISNNNLLHFITNPKRSQKILPDDFSVELFSDFDLYNNKYW